MKISLNTARRSRNQRECARPRAQKRRTATRVEEILSANLAEVAAAGDGGTPKISPQLANNFDDCSAQGAEFGRRCADLCVPLREPLRPLRLTDNAPLVVGPRTVPVG